MMAGLPGSKDIRVLCMTTDGMEAAVVQTL